MYYISKVCIFYERSAGTFRFYVKCIPTEIEAPELLTFFSWHTLVLNHSTCNQLQYHCARHEVFEKGLSVSMNMAILLYSNEMRKEEIRGKTLKVSFWQNVSLLPKIACTYNLKMYVNVKKSPATLWEKRRNKWNVFSKKLPLDVRQTAEFSGHPLSSDWETRVLQTLR